MINIYVKHVGSESDLSVKVSAMFSTYTYHSYQTEGDYCFILWMHLNLNVCTWN